MSLINRCEKEQMDFLGLGGEAPFRLVMDGSPGQAAAWRRAGGLQRSVDWFVEDRQPCLQSINFLLVVFFSFADTGSVDLEWSLQGNK